MTETTQTETVKETQATSEPLAPVDADTVAVEQGDGDTTVTGTATVEVTDGDTSLSATADSPVALTVAVVLGLLVVLGFAAKKFLSK